MGCPLHRDRGMPSVRSMACRPGNLAKTNSNQLPAPTRGNGFAERIQIRQCAFAANSTTGGRYADKCKTWQRSRETNGLTANIAKPAVEITSYTSGAAARTKAGASRYDNKQGTDNEESRSDKWNSHREGVELTCGNNNHVARVRPIHSEGTALAGRLQVCCAGFQYVAGAR